MKDHEFNGVAKCGNPSVRGDRLEQTVWGQVRALLEDPSRVADEYRRRIGQANGKAGPLEQVARLDRQIATVQRGIDRLIDCYAGEFIDKGEFEPRIAGLKLRRSQLQDQQRAAVTAANSERELSLVISRLEDFSAKVTHGLDGLDWLGMREIIHAVVRRVEIDRDSIEVVFRVPPKGGRSRNGMESPRQGILQDCTNAQARNRVGRCGTAEPQESGAARRLWRFGRGTELPAI
jgi:site-specific DNA recombinase